MKRLSIIHYQFVFPSPFLDHSYREFFVSVHLLSTHTHTSLHKLTESDRHAMSVVVIIRLWKKNFFLIFSVNTKRYLSFILCSLRSVCLSLFFFFFSLSLGMILPATSILGYMYGYYNKELIYTSSFYTRYLNMCERVCICVIYTAKYPKSKKNSSHFSSLLEFYQSS